MVNQDAESIISLGSSQYLSEYVRDFSDSYARLIKDEVSSISILSDDAWQKVWLPDDVAAASIEWRRDSGTDYRRAQEAFKERVLRSAQNDSMPRIVLRRVEQLRPHLFPIQSVIVCDMLRLGSYGVPGEYDQHRPERDDVFYTASYNRGLEWLMSLPIGLDERIYVSRRPAETMIVKWREFLLHWDAFYCDRFCSLNLCDDSNGWFLMCHPERLMYFGCKREYADASDVSRMRPLPEPVEYKPHLIQAHADDAHFRNCMIAMYSR